MGQIFSKVIRSQYVHNRVGIILVIIFPYLHKLNRGNVMYLVVAILIGLWSAISGAVDHVISRVWTWDIYWSQHITNNSCLTAKIMISTKFRLRYHFDNRPSFYSNKRHKTKPFIGFSPRGRFREKSSHFCVEGEQEMEYDIIITFYSS